MGDIRPTSPVMLIVAAFSRHSEALDWAQQRAAETWGPIALASDRFEFRETNYYEPTMGAEIKKTFWAFHELIAPERLIEIKLLTNAWEEEYAALGRHPEARPLNLDPGYLTNAKLVLASTKDHAHRIYMDRGIFAEVTLHFSHGAWQPRDWTFPDYRRADYHAFLTQCRNLLRGRGGG
jgi:hypothetical protein